MGNSDQRHAPAALTPGKSPGIHLEEAGWTPGPDMTIVEKKEKL